MAATNKKINTNANKKSTRAKTSSGTSVSRSKSGNTRKSNYNKKNSGKNRNEIKKTHQRKIEDVNDYRDRMAFETGVTMIVIAIISVFLYISYFNLGGVVGKIFGGLSFGLFGWGAWIVPISFFIGYIFVIVNKGD